MKLPDAIASGEPYDPQIVEAFLQSLGHAAVGGVTEIRILCQEPSLLLNGHRTYVGRTVVGYYDPGQYAKAAREIAPFDGKAQIYVCLNPCNSALLARAANRLQYDARETASDADIISLQWFRVDCDPVRPSGISATDAELQQALLCRDAIADELKGHDVQVIRAMSGNGGHLLVRLPDYPNDEDYSALIKTVTKQLSARFSTDTVHVDTSVSNPARIWKMYGTLAVKGDHVADRPHRRATIELPPAPPTPFNLRLLPYANGNGQKSSIGDVSAPIVQVNTDYDGGCAYALSALNGEIQKVQSAPDGQKHNQLIRSACTLGGFVPTGALTETVIEDGLFDAVKDRAADPKKARKTIQDGIRKGATQPRQVPNRKFENGLSTTLKNLNDIDSEGSSGSLGSYPDGFVNFRDAPQPPTPQLRPVPALLPELVPAPLRAWLQDAAERMNAPLEYLFAAMLVSLASLVGRKVGIRPRQFDDWLVVPNMWGMIVGSPGQRKTPAATEGMRHLLRLEANAMKQHQEAVKAYAIDKEVAEAQGRASKDGLHKAAKNGTSGDDLRAMAQQAKEAEELPPIQRRYKVNDATVPALGERLKENPNGLLVYRDELSGFFRTLEKQGNEGDRTFYLEGWNGTQTNYQTDRIARGWFALDALVLSIFGTIQPGPLVRLLRGAANGEEADGLVPRFQILFYPDPRPYRHVDRPPDKPAQNRAFAVFESLDNFDAARLGVTSEGDDAIPFVRFTSDAQDFFDRWMFDLETVKLPAAESTPLIESHLAKYRSLMPSLALLFHLVDVVDGAGNTTIGAPAHVVSLEAAQRAAALCDVLEEHARRVYKLAYEGSLDSAESLAQRIKDGSVHKLKNSNGTRFKVGDVVQRGWSSLSTTEEVNRAVGFLEDRHWLQSVETPPGTQGGRPEQWVYVHPKFQQLQREGGETT